MSDEGGDQSGGFRVYSGGKVEAINVAGRDQHIGTPPPSPQVRDALQPLSAAVEAAPAEHRADAEAKLDALRAELDKRQAELDARDAAGAPAGDADDGFLAGLVEDLVKLVPAAAQAVGTIFAGPVLGALVGPATKFVLGRLGG